MTISRIMAGYVRPLTGSARYFALAVIFVIWLTYTIILALAIVVLPRQLLPGMMAPVVIGLLLSLWMLPDTEIDVYDRLVNAFPWFVGLSLAWPSYVALAGLGVPYINPQRIVLGYIYVIALLGVSQSVKLREQLVYIIKNNKLIFYPYLMYLFLYVATLPFSDNLFGSISGTISEVMLTAVLGMIASFLAYRAPFSDHYAKAWAFGLLVCSLVVIPEVRLHHPFWANYVPNLFIADTTLYAKYMTAATRAGDQLYRAQSIFAGPVYFAQFVALAWSFIFAAVARSTGWQRPLWILTAILAVWAALMANSRTGMVGILIGSGVYCVLLSGWLNKWRRNGGFLRPLVILAVPMSALALGFLLMFSHRFAVYTVGGSQHAGSDEVRSQQFTNAFEAVVRNPVGYGYGNAASVAGTPGSFGPILDSRFLNVLVDLGPLGISIFLWIFTVSIVTGARHVICKKRFDPSLAALVASLVCFFVTIFTVSWDGLQPLAFCMVGIVAGTVARERGPLVEDLPILTDDKPKRSRAVVVPAVNGRRQLAGGWR